MPTKKPNNNDHRGKVDRSRLRVLGTNTPDYVSVLHNWIKDIFLATNEYAGMCKEGVKQLYE